MTAHESLSNERLLDAQTIAALESALHDFVRGDGAMASVEPALRRVAAEAREKGMRAEQVLLVLKDVWFTLPGVDRRSDSMTENASLQRIVSGCIRAYYSP